MGVLAALLGAERVDRAAVVLAELGAAQVQHALLIAAHGDEVSYPRVALGVAGQVLFVADRSAAIDEDQRATAAPALETAPPALFSTEQFVDEAQHRTSLPLTYETMAAPQT